LSAGGGVEGDGDMKTIISMIGFLVLVLGIAPFAMATPVNSNSIIEDGIEYYIQTDKAAYDLGENVEMLFRVTNLRDEDVTIPCSRTGEFNLLAEKNGEAIWALAHWFLWYSPGVELSAGESTHLPPYNWDMKDDLGNLIEPGAYNVIGVMYNEPWNYAHGGTYSLTEVPVPITIIPEPNSMALFVACLSILMRNKRVRHI
jgi:hypothetical protein